MTRKLTRLKFSSGALDGSGEATATTNHTIVGLIKAVHLDYTSAGVAPNVQLEGNRDGMVFLDIDGNATDGWYFPRILAEDYQGTDATDAWVEYPIHDIIKMTVDTGSEDGTVQATILYEEY